MAKKVEFVKKGSISTLRRNGNKSHQAQEVYNWMLREYFPDEVKRLKGDADRIGFTEIHFYAEGLPEVKYNTWNVEE